MHLLLAPDEGELAPDNVIWERTAESGTLSDMRPSAGRFVPRAPSDLIERHWEQEGSFRIEPVDSLYRFALIPGSLVVHVKTARLALLFKTRKPLSDVIEYPY
jgi:hypothetical protein